MNELQRLAYLDAIGVDAYVSRAALPGAAPTRRLAIARRGPGAPPVASAPPTAAATSAVVNLPSLDGAPGGDRRRKTSAAPVPPPGARRAAVEVPRFSLVAIVAGDWLWLEDLEGAPLAREQVWLVRAMAHALKMKALRPDEALPAPTQPGVAQFDWPIHQNQQLDLGVDAARSAVAGFLGRKFREGACRGLVLLGEAVTRWAPAEGQPGPVVNIAGSVQMLQAPGIKREAWASLVSLASP